LKSMVIKTDQSLNPSRMKCQPNLSFTDYG
jgi:hypothetical protein